MKPYLVPYLVNFSFIIIPFFFYQIFWIGKRKENPKSNEIIIVIVAGISTFLCMSFPLAISNGVFYDLRYIPFILAVNYGGLFVSIPLYLLINLYRLYIGASCLHVTFILTTILTIAILLYKRRYAKQTTLKKIILNISYSSFAALSTVLLSHLNKISPSVFGLSSLFFIFSQIITMWLITYFIEKMLESIQLQKNAILSEKLRAISELAASISHEVRNPLTVTKGFLQMLSDPRLTEEKRGFYVKISLTELERAEMIINDYLALTKPQKEALVIADLKEDISYVTNVVRPYSVIHNVTIKESFNNTLRVKYDQNQLRQCLLNLMKNSIEAMAGNGGTLTISTFSERNLLKILIIDTGIGMTKEEVKRLGTPYYTTKEKGTGLGMTVVYSAVQAMNGQISIESKRGTGTRFLISLPAYQE